MEESVILRTVAKKYSFLINVWSSMPTAPLEGFVSLKSHVWKYPMDSGMHPVPPAHPA